MSERGHCDDPGHDDVDELRAEVERLRLVVSNVNAAINRAGIHYAITFWEAIDKIAAERDQHLARLTAASKSYGGGG